MTEAQTWNVERYEKNARFVSDLGVPLIDLLSPQAGERILDLGCGDGTLTKKLVECGAIVTAIDRSKEFVEEAKKRGLDARLGDGQNLTFTHEYDGVFTNAALHWMKRSEDVIKGVHRSLKRGGRFVGECGGEGNIASIISALNAELIKRSIDPVPLNPWTFLSDTATRILLQRNGFRVVFIALLPRPTALPGDSIGWLETFAGDYAGALPETERADFFWHVNERLKPQLYDAQQHLWIADYVRLRFLAIAE